MKKAFQDFIAVSQEKNHCFVDLNKDCIDNYIVWCSIDLYGIPVDLSEAKENDIYDGNFENTDEYEITEGNIHEIC
ncbi:MAG: hypothetical protein ACPKOI_09405 [Pleomorphochaeta sp.]